MTIHLVTGMQGSGKTLFIVKKALEYYKIGKKVYSNVKLNFPFSQIDYNDIVKCKLENAVVILDEAHQLLPSRRSLSKVNVTVVDGFLSMVRKKGLIIFASTQLQKKIDVRFREESDYIYRCEKWVYLKGKWQQAVESEDYDIKIPIIISYLICQMGTGVILEKSFYANPYYKIYDTKQIIQVKGIKEENLK